MATNTGKRARTEQDKDYLPFSEWTYQHFDKTMGFEFDVVSMNKFEPSSLNIDSALIDQLSQIFARAVLAQGAIVHWKESARCDLISQVLNLLVSEHKLKTKHNIKFIREDFYSDRYSGGFVEFVIRSHTIILMVVEAKKDNIDRGIIQNAMELHQASASNGNNITVYGAVTNLTSWLFTRYTPTQEINITNWGISAEMILAPAVTDQIDQHKWVNPLNQLTGYLNWMLNQAIQQISLINNSI